MSLVFLHGSTDNASDGGAATFTIAGLPDDGNWTVKDDDYEGEHNYDAWREADGVHRVDWTWGESKTDGGAYARPRRRLHRHHRSGVQHRRSAVRPAVRWNGPILVGHLERAGHLRPYVPDRRTGHHHEQGLLSTERCVSTKH